METNLYQGNFLVNLPALLKCNRYIPHLVIAGVILLIYALRSCLFEITRASVGGQDVVNSRLLNHYDSYDFLDTPELSAIKDSLCYRALSGFGVRYINVDTPSASSQGMLTGTSVDGDISGESTTRLYTVFY